MNNNLLTLSLEFNTTDACGGILSIRCFMVSECIGSQTRAGKFKFNIESSACNFWAIGRI